jgi:hypothetical protein
MCGTECPWKVKIVVALVTSLRVGPIERVGVTTKPLATGVAGVVIAGPAAADVTSIAPVGPTAAVAPQEAGMGAWPG